LSLGPRSDGKRVHFIRSPEESNDGLQKLWNASRWIHQRSNFAHRMELVLLLVADDKEFQVFQVGLARLRFSSGNSDVMVPAHCFSLSVELVQILRWRYRV
jgi:hypothetical protein